MAQRWSEKVDTTALYAALDDESQEAFLRWAAGQPDSEETVQFLEALMAHYFRKDHLPSDDDATAVYGKEPDELPEPRQSA